MRDFKSTKRYRKIKDNFYKLRFGASSQTDKDLEDFYKANEIIILKRCGNVMLVKTPSISTPYCFRHAEPSMTYRADWFDKLTL